MSGYLIGFAVGWGSAIFGCWCATHNPIRYLFGWWYLPRRDRWRDPKLNGTDCTCGWSIQTDFHWASCPLAHR